MDIQIYNNTTNSASNTETITMPTSSLMDYSDLSKTTNSYLFNWNLSWDIISDSYVEKERYLEESTKRRKTEAFNAMLASEKVLSKEWDLPEEDEAWQDL